MTRRKSGSGFPIAIGTFYPSEAKKYFNLLFFKEKQKDFHFHPSCAIQVTMNFFAHEF